MMKLESPLDPHRILYWALFLGSVVSQELSGTSCKRDWFGSQCQYKCHCSDHPLLSCNQDGSCHGGLGCQRGWFGPTCQYADLAPQSTVTSAWGTSTLQLTDGNDETCNDGMIFQEVTLTWSSPIPFTWMRITVNEPEFLHNFDIQLKTFANTSSLPCANSRNATVNNETVDIHCDRTVTVQQVVLTGEGIRALCSIYINGGRNVALNQNTSQSTTYQDWRSQRAVDGDWGRHGRREPLHCSSTMSFQDGDHRPSWSLQFPFPHEVTRYVLVNRDTLQARLKGFVLTSFTETGTMIFRYEDRESTPQDVYTVTPLPVGQHVSHVQINAMWQIPNGYHELILTLCEVEIYGDAICEQGKYGPECEHTCNCAKKDEACFVSTGGCPSGCAAGFYGERCDKECQPTYYGRDCKERCSSDCLNQQCHPVTGECDGCSPDKAGKFCNQACPTGHYGGNCTERCSKTCGGDGSCHSPKGVCSQGCKDGYTGPVCGEVCQARTFGPSCAMNCSVYCKVDELRDVSVCHHVTGTCSLGCVDDHEGLMCTEKSTEGLAVGLGVGVSLVVIIMAVLVVGILYCYMRRRKASSPETPAAPSHDHMDLSRQENQYGVTPRGGNDYDVPKDVSSHVDRQFESPTQQEIVKYANHDDSENPYESIESGNLPEGREETEISLVSDTNPKAAPDTTDIPSREETVAIDDSSYENVLFSSSA